MRSIRNTVLFSSSITLLKILHVVGLVPYITDNSSERLNLDDGKWVGAVTARETLWAEAAYAHVKKLNCSDIFFTSSKECQRLMLVHKSSYIVHVAPFSPQGEYDVILPDEKLTRRNTHEGVLVFDPYPHANFGHLVIVFVVDVRSKFKCEHKKGIYIDSTRDCLTFAMKKRCRNAIKRNSKRKHWARRCEINFLPVVHVRKSSKSQRKEKKYNYLKCWKGIEGFGQCPELRPENETKDLICNPIRDNTKRCSTTHETVHTSCRVFEICDQAVMLSGGWNRETSGVRFKRNLAEFYVMLRNYGFKKRNIKMFYANGASNFHIPGEHAHQVHPAAMKYAFRYHVQKLCRVPHCVNSLVLYLNSPAKNDGTSLLWDLDEDGIADNSEEYTIRELKEDLELCAANYVHLVVDQSFSGDIADAFKNSKRHRNVIVFASGDNNEYAYNDEYSRHWTRSNHTFDCTWDIHEHSKNAIKHSTPEVKEGERGEVRTTIFGSPCNVYPPFSAKELRQDYLGCQALPTALWIKKLLTSSEETEFGQDYANEPWA